MMRVIVTGATGNLGTSVLDELSRNPEVQEIVGLARRGASVDLPKVTWSQVEIATDNLHAHFAGADAIIHLAWEIRPSHRTETLHAVNVAGSKRVFDAAIHANVKTVIHASSVGAYSPGPKLPVDESHPVNGLPTNTYSQHKAAVEHCIDDMERKHPYTRFVRVRPGLMFKRESAEHIRRVFLGSIYPITALRRRPLPLLPNVPGLILNAVHASDVARAINTALQRDVRGAFNLAADPPLDIPTMAKIANAFTVPMPAAVLRGLAGFAWHAHVQPTEPSWIDLALQLPLLDCSRAKRELDWEPRVSAEAAFAELIDGMRTGGHFATPPLERAKHVPIQTGIRNGMKLLRTRRAKPSV
jgi:nucleoside-diphosphate-sugar epimerase